MDREHVEKSKRRFNVKRQEKDKVYCKPFLRKEDPEPNLRVCFFQFNPK